MITFAQAVMSAEADAICGAGYGQRSDERVSCRHGYRQREWDNRAGTTDLAIPKLRQGSYFPEWLLMHHRRAEQALVPVVATSYLLGVSTRRVEKLVEQLGIRQLSKSQVSEMAAHLEVQVEAFRDRPLDSGHYTFVWMDALTTKVREHGRTVNAHALIAVGVNADGQRKALGVEVASHEDGAGWLAFLRSLTARGLSGVRLSSLMLTPASWPRLAPPCPAPRDSGAAPITCAIWLTKAPRSAQPWIATLVRTIFDQPDADAVRAQLDRVVATIEAKFHTAAEHLDTARDDLLAFTGFPRETWRQIWSNNPQERLNKEIRRRTDVVGIFPNRAGFIRLVGAVLAEQTAEWTEGRRYIGLGLLAKARLIPVQPDQHDRSSTSITWATSTPSRPSSRAHDHFVRATSSRCRSIG